MMAAYYGILADHPDDPPDDLIGIRSKPRDQRHYDSYLDEVRGVGGDFLEEGEDNHHVKLKDWPEFRAVFYDAQGARIPDRVLYWLPDELQYMRGDLNGRPTSAICDGNTMGLTMYYQGIVTYCPETFNPPGFLSQVTIPEGQTVENIGPGSYIGDYYTRSTVFFHETAHLILGDFFTPEICTCPEDQAYQLIHTLL
ncbi:hypothetical protein ABW21_db0204139 [Orbilia brochopaga]|nr:hypothetical protein ABW21_db0204139 [Drechslerella brochopaga]